MPNARPEKAFSYKDLVSFNEKKDFGCFKEAYQIMEDLFDKKISTNNCILIEKELTSKNPQGIRPGDSCLDVYVFLSVDSFGFERYGR